MYSPCFADDLANDPDLFMNSGTICPLPGLLISVT